jgi:hypothetical protein
VPAFRTAVPGGSMVRMGPVVRATEDPPRSRPTSRHLTSPLTVQRELRRCWCAWRLPPTRSHGGSQGFKSPHLHPTTALVTGLAGYLRRADALSEPLPGQQTGSNCGRNSQLLLEARPQACLSPDGRDAIGWRVKRSPPSRRVRPPASIALDRDPSPPPATIGGG